MHRYNKRRDLTVGICIACMMMMLLFPGCDNGQEKAELEKARLALEEERLAAEKERLALEELRKEIKQIAQEEAEVASRPWWEQELANLKGTGKPITESFQLAIEKGDAVDVKNHIDYGEDVNGGFGYGGTGAMPLYIAAREGHTLVAALLIQEGASTTDQGFNDGFGSYAYPLHAVAKGQKADADLIRLLLDKGAKVNAKDDRGRTPLEMIRMYRDHPHAAEIVKVLREYGGTN